MANETISRLVGVFVGAALIVAGLAVFGSGTIAVHPEVTTSVAFKVVSVANDRAATPVILAN
jgi:hypothetical protein